MMFADANPALGQPPRPSPSAGGAASRALDAVRSLLGMRRRFEVDGIRYTERTSEPLHRAISRRGAGRKEFEARFPDGTVQRIRCTPTRVYADVSGPELLPCYMIAEPLLRPGMRVLDAATGTGYGAAWLTNRVGPSGAVVALSRDRESIRYAHSRYRASNVAFEVGWTEALAGEVDGVFDGVVACAALTSADDPAAAVSEWWRLVAPGGWLLVVTPVHRADARADNAPDPPTIGGNSAPTAGPGPATGPAEGSARGSIGGSIGGSAAGPASDTPRIFAPDELSALIAGVCNKPPTTEADAATPTFRPGGRRKPDAPNDLESSDANTPTPEAEIATSSIVNYAAALVRKAVRA